MDCAEKKIVQSRGPRRRASPRIATRHISPGKRSIFDYLFTCNPDASNVWYVAPQTRFPPRGCCVGPEHCFQGGTHSWDGGCEAVGDGGVYSTQPFWSQSLLAPRRRRTRRFSFTSHLVLIPFSTILLSGRLFSATPPIVGQSPSFPTIADSAL
jgi:hypothetical protein